MSFKAPVIIFTTGISRTKRFFLGNSRFSVQSSRLTAQGVNNSVPQRLSASVHLNTQQELLLSPASRGETLSGSYGFTLLEILIAIFIFAIVMTTIYGAFNAVVSRNEAINQGRGLYEMTRNCLDRMASDFSAIYVERPPLYEPPDFDDPPDPYRFVCTEEMVGTESFSRVRFAANAHLPMGKEETTGIAEIIYYVDEVETPEPQYVLRRDDTIYPYDIDDGFKEEDRVPIICKNIEEFSVVCFDGEGKSQAQWDSEERMGKYATPRYLDIKLTVSEEETRYHFQTAVTLPVYREKMEEGRKGP